MFTNCPEANRLRLAWYRTAPNWNDLVYPFPHPGFQVRGLISGGFHPLDRGEDLAYSLALGKLQEHVANCPVCQGLTDEKED